MRCIDILEAFTIPEPNSGCLLWTGYTDKYGYGQWPRKREKRQKAHRVAFEIAHGRPPVGLVCHKCDVPSCVNAAHLFEGTHADNTADMVSKGRSARGERSGTAKLTERIVREIKTHPASLDDTARLFNVSRSLVGQIRQGLVWAHVSVSEERRPAKPKRTHYKITDQQVTEMKERARRGEKLRDIAPLYGLTFSYVGKLVRGAAQKKEFSDG